MYFNDTYPSNKLSNRALEFYISLIILSPFTHLMEDAELTLKSNVPLNSV